MHESPPSGRKNGPAPKGAGKLLRMQQRIVRRRAGRTAAKEGPRQEAPAAQDRALSRSPARAKRPFQSDVLASPLETPQSKETLLTNRDDFDSQSTERPTDTMRVR